MPFLLLMGCGGTPRLSENNSLHVLSLLRFCSGGVQSAVYHLMDRTLQNSISVIVRAHVAVACWLFWHLPIRTHGGPSLRATMDGVFCM